MKRMIPLLLTLLLLAGCGTPSETGDKKLHILATTYPVYLFTTAVTEGYADVEVSLMLNQPTSCLHDYTLTVADMKALEQADVIVMNGAGLEDFMSDALAQSEATVIDCSQDVTLLLSSEHEGHDGHDHDEEYDPHYWLNPRHATTAVATIAAGLTDLIPGDTQLLISNEVGTRSLLGAQSNQLESLSTREVITFHDGFRYLADYLDLTILKSIEEEEGSEASAKEIVEITELIRTHHLPAIFTEVNGSDATAKAVQRETEVALYQLDMMMSGDGSGITPYITALYANIDTLGEALK